MSYLKNNINVILLIFILVVIGVLIGITIVFQTGLETRTGDYEDASTNLTECNNRVHNYQERLSVAEDKVETASQDVSKYDELYSLKVFDLQTAEDELIDRDKTIHNKQQAIDEQKTLIEDLIMDYEISQQTIGALNLTIIKRDDKIRQLREDLQLCEDLPHNVTM